MERTFKRSKTEKELQEREAAGLWRAQALARTIAESDEKITLEVILRVHKEFFEEVRPEIAGRFRVAGEDIQKLKYITPPLGVAVQEEIYKFWRELDVKLSKIQPSFAGKKLTKTFFKKRNAEVVSIAAWTQYQIARIHPFSEGNGRMARLMTNLILIRYKLQPTDIKYEGENKQKYLQSLGEIDNKGDYRMLEGLIVRGMINSYQKLIKIKKHIKNG